MGHFLFFAVIYAAIPEDIVYKMTMFIKWLYKATAASVLPEFISMQKNQ